MRLHALSMGPGLCLALAILWQCIPGEPRQGCRLPCACLSLALFGADGLVLPCLALLQL